MEQVLVDEIWNDVYFNLCMIWDSAFLLDVFRLTQLILPNIWILTIEFNQIITDAKRL